MSFQFVDHSNINRRARRLIRSHVMRGKNSGKVRTRRANHPEPTANKSARDGCRTGDSAGDHDADAPTTVSRHQRQSNGFIVTMIRQIANDLSLVSPAKVAPEALLNLQRLAFFVLEGGSPPMFCRPTGVIGWMWFQLLFEDEAYFHSNIAMASACVAFLTGDSRHSPHALHHMSRAYRLINKRLSSNEALSDTTIAVVATMNLYDRLYGDPQRAMIHLDGVTRMIDLRGGIGELARRKFLIAEKTFRSDIELAMNCSSKPKFSSGDVPQHLVLIKPRRDSLKEPMPQRLAELVGSALYKSVCAELREAVLDTLCLSDALNQASRAGRLEPEAYQSTLIYVSYRLLETEPPRGTDDSGAGEALDALAHLAMIGFVNTFCFGIGFKLMTFPLLAARFRAAATQDDNTNTMYNSSSRPRQLVVFWALFVGRISSLVGDSDDEDTSWFEPKLRTLAAKLGLRTWADARATFRALPWVGAMHDVSGEECWNTVLAPHIPPLQRAGL